MATANIDISDPSKWKSFGEAAPEWIENVKTSGDYDMGAFPDILSLRAFMESNKAAAGKVVPPPPEGVREEDLKITMRDGHEITVRVHRPEPPPPEGSPLAVVYHGGGWCVGEPDGEAPLCRLMATHFGVTSVNVDYRLGPEFKHPTAANDCYDAAKWAAQNASKLGADPSKGFLLSGTSAGGNLAAVVSHLWRDNGDSPKVTGCHLMIPALLDRDYVPEDLQAECQSSRELTNASILSAKAFALFVDAYIPQEQRGDPLFSPLLWPGGHKDLPPQYLQICGADPLRDEALIYERILREQCGVKTKVDLYVGMPHGFWAVFPRMEAGKRFMKDSIEGVRWLLEQK